MWPRIYQCQPEVSLHIYCDLENKWLNDFHKEQVILIKQLFEQYNVKKTVFVKSDNITFLVI